MHRYFYRSSNPSSNLIFQMENWRLRAVKVGMSQVSNEEILI